MRAREKRGKKFFWVIAIIAILAATAFVLSFVLEREVEFNPPIPTIGDEERATDGNPTIAAITVPQCTTLNQPNEVYELQSNVSATGTCFVVNASNVTIDGKGFTIKYGNATNMGSYYGVIASGVNDVTIKNVTIIGGRNSITPSLRAAIFLQQVNGASIRDVFSTDLGPNSATHGVYAQVADGINVTNFYSINNSYGLFLYLTENSEISNSFLLDSPYPGSGGTGVYLVTSENNKFDKITASSNHKQGIRISESTGNSFTNSVLSNNIENGVLIENSINNSFNNVAITGHNSLPNSRGIYIRRAINSATIPSGNTFSRVQLHSNSKGIELTGTKNNTFYQTTVNGSSGDAISLNLGNPGWTNSTGNIFSSVIVTNTAAGFNDLNMSQQSDGTKFIGSTIGRYVFEGSGSIISVENNFGKIEFIEAVSGGGVSFSEDVSISQNLAKVNSESVPGLNKTANITLSGLTAGQFIQPAIFRNGEICDAAICTNHTSLAGSAIKLGVNGWTNYSIGETAEPSEASLALMVFSQPVVWTISQLPAIEASAEGNNGSGETTYVAYVNASGTNAAISISSDGGLTDPTGQDTIPAGNQMFSFSTTDSTVSGLPKISFTGSDQLIIPNFGGGNIYFKFYLNVSAEQPAGNYSNNIQIMASPL